MFWFICGLVLGFGVFISEEFYGFIIVEIVEYCYFLCKGSGYIGFVGSDSGYGVGVYINLGEMFGKFVCWWYLFCIIVKYVFVGDGIVGISGESY